MAEPSAVAHTIACCLPVYCCVMEPGVMFLFDTSKVMQSCLDYLSLYTDKAADCFAFAFRNM